MLRLLTLIGLMSGTAAFADTQTIRFLHFNDLHAHLTEHADLDRSETGELRLVNRGGLARLKTAVDELREENPNNILMNIGDTFHGGVEALYTNGNAIAEPMNALGVDIGVAGNWDYAYGPHITRLRYGPVRSMGFFSDADTKKPNWTNLAANLTITLPLFRRGDYLMPPTAILERDGIKVGFIGITSDIVPRMHKSLAIGLDFKEYSTASYAKMIEQHAKKLRQKGVDIVVVMSELGIHKDLSLADTIKKDTVQVFFSAHTHEATRKPIQSNSGALVVEAGNDGFLGRMDVSFTDGIPLDYDWKLLEIDEKYTKDSDMLALVQKARKPFLQKNPDIDLPSMAGGMTLNQSIDTIIGHAEHPLDRRNALENSFNNSYTDYLRELGDTDVAMTPGFRFDSVIRTKGELFEDNTVANGNITIEDAYRFIPVPYFIASGEIRADKFKAILESNLTAVYSPDTALQSGGWVDGVSGLNLEIDLTRKNGDRITAMKDDKGKTINDRKTLTVTGCARPFDDEPESTLCSYGGFRFVEPLTDDNFNNLSAVNALIDGIKNGAFKSTTRKDITETSGAHGWPKDKYVQPIRGLGQL